jgi:hypothetical protein
MTGRNGNNYSKNSTHTVKVNVTGMSELSEVADQMERLARADRQLRTQPDLVPVVLHGGIPAFADPRTFPAKEAPKRASRRHALRVGRAMIQNVDLQLSAKQALAEAHQALDTHDVHLQAAKTTLMAADEALERAEIMQRYADLAERNLAEIIAEGRRS